jgi:hypothetical protein
MQAEVVHAPSASAMPSSSSNSNSELAREKTADEAVMSLADEAGCPECS